MLSEAQLTALSVIQKELEPTDNTFIDRLYIKEQDRYVSKATLRSLVNKGLIVVVEVRGYPYTVRGNYGRGIRWKRVDISTKYRLVNPKQEATL